MSGFTPDLGPWVAYVPGAPSPGAGAFTTTFYVAARYKRLGKTVHVRITLLITTNGTAATVFTIPAPFPSASIGANAWQALSCSATGAVGIGGRALIDNNSSTIFVTKYDGTYLGQDGLYVHITGTYEAA